MKVIKVFKIRGMFNIKWLIFEELVLDGGFEGVDFELELEGDFEFDGVGFVDGVELELEVLVVIWSFMFFVGR